jgi:cation diffusion facilitator family transporter
MITHETIIKKRQAAIIRTSIVGVAANLLLAGFKAIVGFMTNSIAIMLDAVNNLSDMLSSIVTIIGIRLANKAPDKDHPMGHGRYEYIGTAFIAVLILYIGFTALMESVKKIIHPEPVSYTTPSLIIITVAIAVKVFLSIYFRNSGKKVDSDSLKASATDALLDSVISFATLISAIIFIVCGIATEAYLAAIISLVIMHTGIKMLREIFSVILGERVDAKLAKDIKKSICEVDGVRGAFDLMIHDYGTNMAFCSVNIEVNDDITAREIDDISREVRRKIYYGYNIFISSVGIYSINTKNEKINAIYHRVKEVLSHYEYVIQMHGFHVDEAKKEISFDIIISFDAKNRRAYYLAIKRHLHKVFPKYRINIALDYDYSD